MFKSAIFLCFKMKFKYNLFSYSSKFADKNDSSIDRNFENFYWKSLLNYYTNSYLFFDLDTSLNKIFYVN